MWYVYIQNCLCWYNYDFEMAHAQDAFAKHCSYTRFVVRLRTSYYSIEIQTKLDLNSRQSHFGKQIQGVNRRKLLVTESCRSMGFRQTQVFIQSDQKWMMQSRNVCKIFCCRSVWKPPAGNNFELTNIVFKFGQWKWTLQAWRKDN